MNNGFLKIIAFSGITSVFFILFVSSLFFFLNIPVMSLNFPLAIILSLIFNSFVFKNFKKTFLAHIINFIIICIFALYFAHTMDFTADSLWYHIPAINLLKEGWLPYNIEQAYLPAHDWINFFAKGPWVINSVLALFFGNFEASKLLSVFSICLSILFSYMAFRTFDVKKPVCIAFALLAGFNPVSLVQFHTFLVDGVLSSMIVILISSLVLYKRTKETKFLIPFAISFCIALNSKLSAVAYLFVICAGALYFLKKDYKFILTSISALVVSLFITGFNPYGVNLIKHKNPFYPIGSHKIDIVKDSCPKEIIEKTRVTKFIVSIFSETTMLGEKPVLKIPFTVTKADLKKAHVPQAYMSGFGFLFSGVLILSLIFMALSYKKKDFKDFIIFETILTASVLINPECWWARFVPHFYLVPLVSGFYLFIGEEKKFKIFGYVLLCALLLNLLVTGGLHLAKVLENQRIQNELAYGLKHFDGKIYVDNRDGRIDGIRIRLKNLGVNYEERAQSACEGTELKFSTVKLCLVPRR